MFADLIKDGVGVRETNPLGHLLLNYPARNHKKLIIADDVAYVGGVNFSDHNFAWRDFMVRVQDARVTDFLTDDFAATWSGGPVAAALELEGLSLFCLDGRTNDRFFAAMSDLIGRARREIVVLSAYLTFPFTAPLSAAARRGVAVRLITPWNNNKPLVRDYLLGVARRSGFEVTLLAEMSHGKALLIDGEQLVVGSCNFDFVGLAAEEEIVAVIRSPELIEDFRHQIVAPLVERAALTGTRRVGPLRSAAALVLLRAAQVGVKAARGARRTSVDWV
jgi:cardiolipin synthase